MAQLLRVHSDLAEDQSLIPTPKSSSSQLPVTTAPEDSTPSSGVKGHINSHAYAPSYTYAYVFKGNKIFKKMVEGRTRDTPRSSPEPRVYIMRLLEKATWQKSLRLWALN